MHEMKIEGKWENCMQRVDFKQNFASTLFLFFFFFN